jgi:hypothetical protein
MSLQSLTRAAASACCLLAAESHAEFGIIECPVGATAATFTPGITNTPKPTTIDSYSVFGACLSLSESGVIPLFFRYQVQGNLSCGATTSTADITILWNDYTQSRAVGSAITVRPTGQVVAVVNGTILDGHFKGGTFNYTVAQAQQNVLDCFTPGGVKYVSGASPFTLISL